MWEQIGPNCDGQFGPLGVHSLWSNDGVERLDDVGVFANPPWMSPGQPRRESMPLMLMKMSPRPGG